MIARVDGARATSVPLSDRGILHGDSVFELVAVRGGRARFLDWHWERLREGLAAFRFIEPPGLEGDVSEVLAEAGPVDGVLRIVVTRGEGPLRAPLASLPARRVVVFREAETSRTVRLRAWLAGAPRISASLPSAHAKYARYLPYLLANDDALAHGFDEALLADAEGRVIEAATANVIAVVEGRLVTPPRSSGALAGIMRRFVVERAARELGLAVDERALAAADLSRATEVFLTSSVRGFASLAEIHGLGRVLTFAERTPICDALATRLDAELRSR